MWFFEIAALDRFCARGLRIQFREVVHVRLLRWAAGPSAVALILLLSPAASAQDAIAPARQPGASETAPAAAPSQGELERARALFAEGLNFVAQEDWGNAADRFTQVHDIRPSPVVSYNLASALTHLGRLVESSQLLTQVLSDAQADEETRRAAQLLLSKIEPGIGSVTLRVYGNAEGCSFSLDDRPIDVSSGTLTERLDPGVHRVAVVRDGETILNPQVTLGGAFPMQAQLSLEIPAKAAPVPVVALAPPPPQPRVQPDLRLSQPVDAPDEHESILEQWWLWAGAGAVIAGGVIATLVLTSGDDPAPISGNAGPGVIHTRVTGAMP
jgi:hypothetical protein